MTRRTIFATVVVAVCGLMLVSGLVLAIALAARGTALPGSGRVAVLEIDGIIDDDERALRQLREFRKDASVRALLVSINSPGGAVGPSQSIYREVRRMRERDKLPVVAAIGTVGASGGYYIALAADSIFVLPGSMTGSIGVIMEFPDVTGLMQKVGVDMQVVKSAEHKDVGSPFRKMSEEDRQLLQGMVQDVYSQFFDVVVTERKLAAAQVAAVADGRVVSGNQALHAGLVDRLGNFEDALATAGRMGGLGSKPELVYAKDPDRSMLDLLLGRESSQAAARLTRSLGTKSMPQLKYVIPF